MADSSASTWKWHEFYKAALFEPDPSKTRSRIEEAREALIVRSRELFTMSTHDEEEMEAIEDAFYALQALESCLESNIRDRRRAARAS